MKTLIPHTRKILPAAFALSAAMLASPAQAELTAYEGFDTTAGPANGAAGATSFGWYTDSWTALGDNAVVSEGLSYRNLQTTGGALMVSGAIAAAPGVKGMFRETDADYNPDSDGQLWFSALIKPKVVGSPSGGGYIQVSLGNGNVNALYFGSPWAGTQWGFGGERTNPKSNPSGVALADGVTTFGVFMVDFATDKVRFWINPDPSLAEPPAHYAEVSLNQDFYADRVQIAFYDYGANASDGVPHNGADFSGTLFDEIRLGTDWASVTPTSGTSPTWAGFPIGDNSVVETGDWLGTVFIGMEPWVWVYSAEDWMYIDESLASASGGWIYFDRSAAPTGATGSTWAGYELDANNNADTGDWLGLAHAAFAPWIYVYSTGTWVYIENGYINDGGGWGYAVNP